jgi:hypothetical protein
VGWHEARKKAGPKHDTKLFWAGPAQHDVPDQVWVEAEAHGRARARSVYAGTKRPVTRHEKAHYTLWQPPAREPTTTSRPAQPTLPFATCQPTNLMATQTIAHFTAHKNEKTIGPVPLALVLS